ncbi:hypothetical protein POM88_000729 [Heracleum sosnowskyi]|uniref:Uncharacterized protein n=1 Tax=Heracleum sosnowskyi TaxID=360622 RepID=A0AAD8JBN9_9APIA|nr:hypothetical protein POM88_000729 [Heracleum sosnowskyi]
MSWFRLYTLCSDSSGTVPIVLQNEEVMKLCGKTVYNLEVDENQVGYGDKFPPILKELERKMYNIAICLTEDNVKKGSNVYNASKISDPEEMSASHSPNFKSSIELKPTEMSIGTLTSNNSPPTGNSSNKTRARKSNEALDCELPDHTSLVRNKNVKIENVMLRWSVRNVTPFGIQNRIKKNWKRHVAKQVFVLTKINVIFWDTLADEFQNAINTQNPEHPLILIVSSGKVGKWKGIS